MAIISSKCPNCGANLEIDDKQQNVVCPFCGNSCYVERAINNTNNIYNITNNTTIINQSVKNDAQPKSVYLENNSKAKKMLKTSAIMDFVTAAVYLAVSIAIIVIGATMMNFKPSEDAEGAEVLGEVIGGFFVILIGIIFVFFGALSLILFIVSVAYGGTTLGLLKKPVDVVARRVRAIKVGAIFGFIFAAALIVAGIAAAIGAPAAIALFLALAAITIASSIVNLKMVNAVEEEWRIELERRQEAGEYNI